MDIWVKCDVKNVNTKFRLQEDITVEDLKRVIERETQIPTHWQILTLKKDITSKTGPLYQCGIETGDTITVEDRRPKVTTGFHESEQCKMIRHNIRGDGSCLFSAVFFCYNDGEPPTEAVVDELRMYIAHTILKNREEYQGFLEGEFKALNRIKSLLHDG